MKGAFEIEKENYQNLKEALKEVFENLKQIQNSTITINQKKFTVRLMLGADMKFIAIVFGLNQSKSNFCCPWCYFDNSIPVNIDDEWPISRTQRLAAEYTLNGNEAMGHKHKPILDFIEFDSCVIDSLHLLLRVSDQLLKDLIAKIDTADYNINSTNFTDRPLLNMLNLAIKNKCKIYKPFYVKKKKSNPNEKSIKMRSLNGNERLRIFEEFVGRDNMLRYIFPPNLINLDVEEFVWEKFYNLFIQLKSFSSNPIHAPQNSIENLKANLKEWLGFFLLSHHGKITPYVHAFVYHTTQFLEMYGEITIYNLQSLEKLNDFMTIYYQRSTNRQRRNLKYMKQLLHKRNRIEFYSLGWTLDDL